MDKWGFTAKGIQTLIDDQATQKNILDALESLQNRSKAGDNVFVYFSGHGTSAKNTNNNKVVKLLPYASGAFIPVDFVAPKQDDRVSVEDLKSSLIIGKWHLQPVFKKARTRPFGFVVMDSCFSGNAVRTIATAENKKMKSLNAQRIYWLMWSVIP
ncbi:MAG: caspase family protein [Moraxellaceae bacterium]|nr:caspase family protein [Moraxellaceae bacterium]